MAQQHHAFEKQQLPSLSNNGLQREADETVSLVQSEQNKLREELIGLGITGARSPGLRPRVPTLPLKVILQRNTHVVEPKNLETVEWEGICEPLSVDTRRKIDTLRELLLKRLEGEVINMPNVRNQKSIVEAAYKGIKTKSLFAATQFLTILRRLWEKAFSPEDSMPFPNINE